MDALTPFALGSTLCLSRRDLLAAGVTPRAVAAAVHSERLIRARRGVYLPSTAPERVVKAVRVGGLAAGTTAAETFGMWVPERRVTEVWLPHTASRMRSATNRRVPLVHSDRSRLRTHWQPLIGPDAASSWRVGACDAVVQCIRRLPRDLALAVLDSALRTGAVGPYELPAVERAIQARRQWWIGLADGRAGSGTETLVRLALHDVGLRVTPQAKIAGVGFVDLLVGSVVVVEVDSESWHSTAKQRAEDFRRDLALRLLGFVVIRVSYQQAMTQRPEVVRSVLAAVRATGTLEVSLRRHCS